jgi:hypothetical protein
MNITFILIIVDLIVAAIFIFIYLYLKRDRERILKNGMRTKATISRYYLSTDISSVDGTTSSEFVAILNFKDIDTQQFVESTMNCLKKTEQSFPVNSVINIIYEKRIRGGKLFYHSAVLEENNVWKPFHKKRFFTIFAITMSVLFILTLLTLR